MIALAMCCKPSLLICDEPTTALDVTVQKSVLELIKELQRETGMGVIFITHDLGVVAQIADRAIVMYKGSIIEEGPVKDIFTQPQQPYTRALIACRPVNHQRGSRLPVVADFLNPGPKQPAAAPLNAPDTKAILAPKELIQVRRLSVHYPRKKTGWARPLATQKR
ncbi:hypothetical protein LWM68_04695 [Niabella sp. W65]|nr:hypothetical protein [Niabella sp. W65]MCH7362129.1 hypothetical protein [Niabella sp. W65]ULT46336.1 hypothetical protein KRR40_23300 [Niabella sp. I65]